MYSYPHTANDSSSHASGDQIDCVNLDRKALGEDIDALLSGLKDQGDELADAVVHDFRDAPDEIRQLLSQGMSQGVATIPEPPESFRRLLRDAEQAVSTVSPETLSLARTPYMLMGPLWISVALGPGALVHTYSDPGIAAVLMSTGNLSDAGAARRLLETQIWNIRVLLPDGLSIGGPGYIQTLQVRLLHARVRNTLLGKGWSAGGAVLPINQVQMIRTWLDFTLVGFRALEKIGFEFSAKEQRSIYSMWHLIGRLLGIDCQLLNLIQDAQDAEALLSRIDANCPAPNEQSKVLTRAMLNAVGARLAGAWGMPSDVGVLFAESLCRTFHGDGIADQLGLSANWTASLLPVYSDANRYRLMRAERDAVFREGLIERSIKAFDAIQNSLKGGATFEHVISHLSDHEQLPLIKA